MFYAPLTGADLPEMDAVGFLRLEMEGLVKGAAGFAHAQVGVEHHHGLAHGLEDGLGVVRGQLEAGDVALLFIDIHQRDHRAVDLVVARAIGADAQ